MDVKKEIELIKDPLNINEAVFASSPNVLKDAFDHDPHVRFLINAGKDVVPLIKKEIDANGTTLNDITLACYAYILSRIDVAGAAKVLTPFYQKAIHRPPAPFAIHFITHTLREDGKLRLNSTKLFYTHDEQQETLKHIKAGGR
jgi:hypothetical protein